MGSQDLVTPELVNVTSNPAEAAKDTTIAGKDDDGEADLFASDDEEEEEDSELVRIREERLAAYREKKAAKPKVAAKSIVTVDIKPWGRCLGQYLFPLIRV